MEKATHKERLIIGIVLLLLGIASVITTVYAFGEGIEILSNTMIFLSFVLLFFAFLFIAEYFSGIHHPKHRHHHIHSREELDGIKGAVLKSTKTTLSDESIDTISDLEFKERIEKIEPNQDLRVLVLDTSVIVKYGPEIMGITKDSKVFVGPKIMNQVKDPSLRQSLREKFQIVGPNEKYLGIAREYLTNTSKHQFYLAVTGKNPEYKKTKKYKNNEILAKKILKKNGKAETTENLIQLAEKTYQVDAADTEVLGLALQKCNELKSHHIIVGEKDSHLEEAIWAVKKSDVQNLSFVNPYKK